MKAKRGDWLVDADGRRGRITAVKHEDGRPPFLVRWLGAEREVLVYPGPDTRIITAGGEAPVVAARAWRSGDEGPERRGTAGTHRPRR